MSANSLLGVNQTGTGEQQVEYGYTKGALLATGTATLVAGTLTVSPGFVVAVGAPLAGIYTVVAVPASSANVVANSGALTIAYPTGTSFSITSANGADTGTYRWFIWA